MEHLGNLYLVDDEIRSRGSELSSHREFFSYAIDQWIKIVDYLCSQIEGETANSLQSLANNLRPKPDELDDAGASYQSDCNQFVSSIDAADGALY